MKNLIKHTQSTWKSSTGNYGRLFLNWSGADEEFAVNWQKQNWTTSVHLITTIDYLSVLRAFQLDKLLKLFKVQIEWIKWIKWLNRIKRGKKAIIVWLLLLLRIKCLHKKNTYNNMVNLILYFIFIYMRRNMDCWHLSAFIVLLLMIFSWLLFVWMGKRRFYWFTWKVLELLGKIIDIIYIWSVQYLTLKYFLIIKWN